MPGLSLVNQVSRLTFSLTALNSVLRGRETEIIT
jgi:hypothetical protein